MREESKTGTIPVWYYWFLPVPFLFGFVTAAIFGWISVQVPWMFIGFFGALVVGCANGAVATSVLYFLDIRHRTIIQFLGLFLALGCAYVFMVTIFWITLNQWTENYTPPPPEPEKPHSELPEEWYYGYPNRGDLEYPYYTADYYYDDELYYDIDNPEIDYFEFEGQSRSKLFSSPKLRGRKHYEKEVELRVSNGWGIRWYEALSHPQWIGYFFVDQYKKTDTTVASVLYLIQAFIIAVMTYGIAKEWKTENDGIELRMEN